MATQRIPSVAIWPEPSAAGSGSSSGGGPGFSAFDVASDPRFSGGAVGDGAANDRAALSAMDAGDHDNLIPQADDAFLVGSDLTITRATWFQEGGIIRPSGAGVDVVFEKPIVAGSWQIFDESLGGTVALLRHRAVDVCWYGCSAELSEAENEAIIVDLLDRYDALIVPEFVPWAGTVPIAADTGLALVTDYHNGQMVLGGGRFTIPAAGTKGHITLKPFARNGRAIGLWVQPNSTATGVSGPEDAGSTKYFLDDYDTEAANPDIWGNVSYRDGTSIGNVREGSLGFGVIRHQVKANGRFVPFAPEMHFGTYGSSQNPMRIVRLQPRPAVAGNFFAPTNPQPYVFDFDMPCWKAGQEVVQGQLINECGKIYEAQSSGVTGEIPVIHATYRKKRLNLMTVTGVFQVGETLKELATAGVPNADLEANEGGGNYLLQKWNQVDFTPGATVTGQTSGATGVIVAVTNVDVDVDNNDNNFVPPGPAVWGRIESDGAIDWLFMDNIIGYIRGNPTMKALVLLGDDVAFLPPPGFPDVGTMLIEDLAVRQGKRVRFLNATGTEADAGFHRTANNKFEVAGPSPANGELHLYGRYGQPGYFRLLDNQATTSGIPFVFAAVNKLSLATTLSMATGNYAVFADAGPTSFTGFTNLRPGEFFLVRFTTGNTTLVHHATDLILGGADLTPPSGTMLLFQAHSTTGASLCTALPTLVPRRSVNKTNGATTKSMADGNFVVFADTAPTNFTQFTGLTPGQRITVHFSTANTTLVHSANLKLPSGLSITPAADTVYEFVAIGPSAVTIPRVA